MKRLVTVKEVRAMQGRTRGFCTVIEATGRSHTFFDPQFLPHFPDLKAGDKLLIEYTSGPSCGGWHIVEKR